MEVETTTSASTTERTKTNFLPLESYVVYT
jgi:hypothetical protein